MKQLQYQAHYLLYQVLQQQDIVVQYQNLNYHQIKQFNNFMFDDCIVQLYFLILKILIITIIPNIEQQQQNIQLINHKLNMKLSNEKIITLVPIFKQNFIKSCVSDTGIQQILQHAQLLQPAINQILYKQGQCISSYYFLLRGRVSLCHSIHHHDSHNKSHHPQSSLMQQIQLLQNYKTIGQYFNSQHNLRQYTSIITQQYTQIIKIPKKLFDNICSPLIDKYNNIQKYVRNVLKIHKKINILDIFNINYYRLGSYIKLIGDIGIILSGQCKIIMIQSTRQINDRMNNKSILPSIQITKPIYSSKQKQKQLYKEKEIKKQIAIIGQNQWLLTQNIQNTKQYKYKYLVISQQLCLLTFSINYIHMLSDNIINMLSTLHQDRKNIVNFQYRDRLSVQRCYNRQQSYSPKIVKQKINQANKILAKLDPNISPNSILKKYKLGYNLIRYENHCKQKNYVNNQNNYGFKIEKTQRKIKNYYKVKDWTQYVKMPKIFNQI